MNNLDQLRTACLMIKQGGMLSKLMASGKTLGDKALAGASEGITKSRNYLWDKIFAFMKNVAEPHTPYGTWVRNRAFGPPGTPNGRADFDYDSYRGLDLLSGLRHSAFQETSFTQPRITNILNQDAKMLANGTLSGAAAGAGLLGGVGMSRLLGFGNGNKNDER